MEGEKEKWRKKGRKEGRRKGRDTVKKGKNVERSVKMWAEKCWLRQQEGHM